MPQDSVNPDRTLSNAPLVLSLRDGMVWASWSDDREPVLLGEHDSVLVELQTFILQAEVATRLLRAAGKTLDS
jgi:hypothetical protein